MCQIAQGLRNMVIGAMLPNAVIKFHMPFSSISSYFEYQYDLNFDPWALDT